MALMQAIALPNAELVGTGLTRKQWLIARESGIGASEIAAVLGISPWETPMSLWLRKRGQLPPVDETPAMRWGSALEQPIARQWSKDTGIKSLQPTPLTIYRSKVCPSAMMSPDRFTADGGAVVEIKNVGHYRLDEWDEGVPDYYWAQTQFQLAVSGLEMCHIVALVGGQDLRWRRIERDLEWQDEAFEATEKFWKLVTDGTPPEIDGEDVTKKALSSAYEAKVSDPVEGGSELALAVAAYLDASEAEKTAKSAKNLAQNRIQMVLREHELGTVEGEPFVTIKTVHRSGYEVAPSDYARINILKGAKQ